MDQNYMDQNYYEKIKNQITSIVTCHKEDREKFLSNLLIVLSEFADYIDLDKNAIEEYRVRKLQNRGGFEKRIQAKVLFVPSQDEKSLLSYLQKSKEYPLLNSADEEDVLQNYVVFPCDKLVRDNVPQMSIVADRMLIYQILSEENEYKIALYKKLEEEYQELVEAKEKDEYREEIADIIELVYVIKKLIG